MAGASGVCTQNADIYKYGLDCSDGTYVAAGSERIKCWIDCTGLLQCFLNGASVWQAFDGGYDASSYSDDPYYYDRVYRDENESGCVSLGNSNLPREPLLIAVVPS